MAHKQTGQASFFETFFARCGLNRRLQPIDGLIDGTPMTGLVKPMRSGAWGRPSYPPLSMLKALLLQRWYALAYEWSEEALADRWSFRRLCGFGLTTRRRTPRRSAVPTGAGGGPAGLPERLFAELDRQLVAKGLFVKSGTLIDATLIEAARNRTQLLLMCMAINLRRAERLIAG